jgi:hypothetical protein
VRSTVNALLEGREIGMEEGPELSAKKPPPPKPKPPPPPPPVVEKPKAPRDDGDRARGRLAADYVGQAFAPQAAWESGLGIALSVAPGGPFYVGIGYVAFQPVEGDSDAARVKVARYPLRAFVGYEIPVDRFRFAGELGVLAEYTRRTTTETALGVAPTSAEDRVGFAASPRVVARYQVWERASVGVGVGIDVFFNNSRYVADLGGRRETLLSPYRVRAGANAGVAVDLW